MKKNTLLKSAMGACILLISMAGLKAVQQYPDQDDWHHDRDSYYRGEGWRMHLFARVRQDLDHVQSAAFSGGDEFRIARTKEDLNELQRNLEAGRYEEHRLDETIASLRTIMADNRLTPRDRDMLSEDLNHLREYREHHEHWCDEHR